MKDSDKTTKKKCKNFDAGKCEEQDHLNLYLGFTRHCPVLCGTCATCQDSSMKFKFNSTTKDCGGHVAIKDDSCTDPEFKATCRGTCGVCGGP